MGHNDRLRGHLQCAQHCLVTGVSKVHQDPQSVALLHNFCAKSRQSTKMSGRGDHVAQRRHHVVLFMKQLKVSHTAFVHFFHPFQVPLDNV